MEIETFEIEEQGAGTEDAVEAEALALAQQLGLEGQMELTAKKADGAQERFQYPEMTAQEVVVYGAIFPAHMDIKKYGAGIIPVRVLQVAAHALEFCDSVQVWYRNVPDPDPLLVGIKGKTYSPDKRFRLARWGDGLRDFSELMNEARDIIKQKMKGDLEQAIAEAKEKMACLDSLVAKKLRGEPIHAYISVSF